MAECKTVLHAAFENGVDVILEGAEEDYSLGPVADTFKEVGKEIARTNLRLDELIDLIESWDSEEEDCD